MRTNGGGRWNRAAVIARLMGSKGVQIRRATCRGYVIEGSTHGGLLGFLDQKVGGSNPSGRAHETRCAPMGPVVTRVCF